MKKIRINELARELEVKAHEILDLLPELGVTEKKTHSSSIDEDVAFKLKRHYGFDAPADGGHSESYYDDSVDETPAAPEPVAAAPAAPATPATPAAPATPAPVAPDERPSP